jgi:hypothetical protein
MNDLNKLRSAIQMIVRILNVLIRFVPSRYAAQLRRIISQLQNMLNRLETLDAIAGLSRDIDRVFQAAMALNRLQPITAANAPEAARQFGILLRLLGNLMNHLPAPLNTYGQLFEQENVSGFFSNLQRAMQPHMGSSAEERRAMTLPPGRY